MQTKTLVKQIKWHGLFVSSLRCSAQYMAQPNRIRCYNNIHLSSLSICMVLVFENKKVDEIQHSNQKTALCLMILDGQFALLTKVESDDGFLVSALLSSMQTSLLAVFSFVEMYTF